MAEKLSAGAIGSARLHEHLQQHKFEVSTSEVRRKFCGPGSREAIPESTGWRAAARLKLQPAPSCSSSSRRTGGKTVTPHLAASGCVQSGGARWPVQS